jgi:hypothetical protein
MIVQPGETSVIAHFVIRDTTGARMTGIAWNTAGLVAEYRHSDAAAWTAITLASGTLGTWASGGFVEDSYGLYQLGLPNAAIPDGVGTVFADYSGIVRLRGVTDMDVVEIRLDARGIPAIKAGQVLTFGDSGLPVLSNGMGGEGVVLPYGVNLRTTAIAAIWSYLKSAAGALATTTFGRFIHDKLSLLGTAGATVENENLNAGEMELVIGDTYSQDLGNEKQFSSPPGFPDPTGLLPIFGVGPLDGESIFTEQGRIVSWDSGTGVIVAAFPFSEPSTSSLSPSVTAGAYGGSWHVPYLTGERTGGRVEVRALRKWDD